MRASSGGRERAVAHELAEESFAQVRARLDASTLRADHRSTCRSVGTIQSGPGAASRPGAEASEVTS